MQLTQYLSPADLELWHELVDPAQRIVILGHAGPDGDAMGAILAMTHYLASLGKQATPMTPNACPDFLHWLPGGERVVVAKNNPAKAQALFDEADLVVCMDFNTLARLEDLCPMAEACTAPRILIDHHLDPQPIARLTISDPSASATCQILFCLLYQLGAYPTINRQTASCLYCGMMTDTGAFAYNCNKPEVFNIVALLLERGIDKDKIYRRVYYSYAEKRLRLMGYLMYRKMIYIHAAHTAIFSLDMAEMHRFNYRRGDAEGFVNMPLQIKDTKLSISLREDTEKPLIRVSLRSVGDFPCNKMAEEFFNGGGHLNAAGGSLPKPMNQALQTARRAVEAYMDLLK